MFALHTNWMVCHSKSMSSSIITQCDNKHQTTCAIDKIYSSMVETARTDDNFQGFKADNNSKVRPEAMPNN
jgi:hypothetical protein